MQLSMTYAASLLAGASVECPLFYADLHFLRAVEVPAPCYPVLQPEVEGTLLISAS